AGWAAISIGLAGLTVLALGQQGLQDWLHAIAIAQHLPGIRFNSVGSVIGPGLLATAVSVAAAGIAMVIARLVSREGPELPIAAPFRLGPGLPLPERDRPLRPPDRSLAHPSSQSAGLAEGVNGGELRAVLLCQRPLHARPLPRARVRLAPRPPGVRDQAAAGGWSGRLAPEPGFEPGTVALTARCSTVELLRNARRRPVYPPTSAR